MTSTTTFHLVRHGTAKKLGANSAGAIRYAVLIDLNRTEPYISLTANEGGGGYFSREAVPISALRRCAEQAGTATGTPLGARAFKPAFTGRSTNNGYFAVAAMCAEGLLNRVQRDGPGRGQPLADAGYWDDWTAEVLAQVAEQGNDLPVFHIGKPPAEPAAEGATTEQQAKAVNAGASAAEQPAGTADAAATAETEAHDEPNSPADSDMDAVDAGAEQSSGKTRRKAKARA